MIEVNTEGAGGGGGGGGGKGGGNKRVARPLKYELTEQLSEHSTNKWAGFQVFIKSDRSSNLRNL